MKINGNPHGKPSPDTEPSLQELQAIYDERSPIGARFHDMTWSSWFRINSRMVSRLRIGRLFLGGDAAHIHSPAGAQGMNTGIQDMINLCWKLARVVAGDASDALLDTYEADRLPVMRNVLQRTDTLTTAIGTENKIVRTLFNHVAPLLAGTDLVQVNATAGMSQVALNYRDSDLSEHHGHGGSLHAGDRLPELAVRQRRNGNWSETRLLPTLDPSGFTLLVAGTDPAQLGSAAPEARLVEIDPATDPADAKRFADEFGKHGSIVLVRPDGYAGLVCPPGNAADRVAAYRATWLSTPHPSH